MIVQRRSTARAGAAGQERDPAQADAEPHRDTPRREASRADRLQHDEPERNRGQQQRRAP